MPYTAITTLYAEATETPAAAPRWFSSSLQHCNIHDNIDLYTGAVFPSDTPMNVLSFNTSGHSTLSQTPTAKQQCTLALLCTDAIIVQLDDLNQPCPMLSTLFTAALQLAQSSSWLNKRSIKLFFATSKTDLMFRNKDVHAYAKAAWQQVAAPIHVLPEFFEILYLGLSETCLYAGLQGRLRDCADASHYLDAPGSPPNIAMQVSSTVPAQFYKSYVSLVWANVQAHEIVDMQIMQGALVQPICANVVEQQMLWSVWQSPHEDGKQPFQDFVQQCSQEVMSTAVLQRAISKQVEHVLKGFDDKVAAFFPFITAFAMRPCEMAISQEVKAHRAMLEQQIACSLTDLVVKCQARIRATFHLVYFCEQLGVAATGSHCDRDPFASCDQPLRDQIAHCESWRALKPEEVSRVMIPWTQPRDRSARDTLVSFSHRNKLRTYTQADHAMQSACHILQHTNREMLKMCSAASAASDEMSEAAEATLLQPWEQAMYTELTNALQCVVQSLVEDVKLAALQGLAAIPPEVRQIVLSKLEPCRWSRQQDWFLRLTPQCREVRPMPQHHGWPNRRGQMLAYLQMLGGGHAMLADMQGLADDSDNDA